ncbi:MAG: YgiQ family radical SAM protein [Fusobacteria bacterium]|nr:YgiQ family radical SAM protein [Fusobacteriota bacterium]
MFLPTTQDEMEKSGWKNLDIILVSGDTYIDSTYNGIAIIGKWLVSYGYKVGIIAQPSLKDSSDILRLGLPNLYWGVSAGLMDSMVSNYTALKKPRRHDDLTPGGENTRRPDRATLAYCNLIKQFDSEKKPIVLGGVEASLRRFAHYDFWQDKIRKSILIDCKANFLVYGMGEKTILELTRAIEQRKSHKPIKGLCYIDKKAPSNAILLPSFDEVISSHENYSKAFELFYHNQDYKTAQILAQKQDERYIIHTPPQAVLTTLEMDKIYSMGFENDVHPYYKKMGSVKALDTTQFSITTHRGCYGECNFCAIALHQGKYISMRSETNIIEEAKLMTQHAQFKGIISDVGGPTANMYGFECSKRHTIGSCPPTEESENRCLFPNTCKGLQVNHLRVLKLLEKLRKIPEIKHIFIASGIRYDLIMADKEFGKKYLEEVLCYHISGQMKIAPEHTEKKILDLMGKPSGKVLNNFIELFSIYKNAINPKMFLTYYFIAAHPGCEISNMYALKDYSRDVLHIKPEQTQIFTPTPSTYSTLMYLTEKGYRSRTSLFVEKESSMKQRQKDILIK